MVSWDNPPISSDDESMKSQPPMTMECTEWIILALNHVAHCEHRAPCEELLAFESTDSGRRFLGCAKKDVPKCNYVEWIDPEWPIPLKQALARIWTMYEEEVTMRLIHDVVKVEEVCKVLKDKRKMENDLRFFKVNFAKMVADVCLNYVGISPKRKG
ncbi:uncharacterized protein [Aegilops tauschii subsp. strangulata]|uniref:uncharacterized protein n=1 Tax=Aegilops tauschii subsp. strangulata TaxID=200361 RepID=UPI003CC881AF